MWVCTALCILAFKIEQQLTFVNILRKYAWMEILTVRLAQEYWIWSRIIFCSTLDAFGLILSPLVEFG